MLRVTKEFTTYTLLVTGDDSPSYRKGLGGCVKAGARDAPAAADNVLLTVDSINEFPIRERIKQHV